MNAVGKNLKQLRQREKLTQDALAHQSAPAVFPEGEDGEPHHVGAAARYGGAACQSGQSQHGADGLSLIHI